MFDALVNSGPWDGLVIETFGSGNIPQKQWMIDSIQKLIDQGTVVINISQCTQGYIDHQLYQNAKILDQMGVIEGKDMTTEAAITKLMNVLGTSTNKELQLRELNISLAGECSFKN
jgi:L-asparaginase